MCSETDCSVICTESVDSVPPQTWNQNRQSRYLTTHVAPRGACLHDTRCTLKDTLTREQNGSQRTSEVNADCYLSVTIKYIIVIYTSIIYSSEHMWRNRAYGVLQGLNYYKYIHIFVRQVSSLLIHTNCEPHGGSSRGVPTHWHNTTNRIQFPRISETAFVSFIRY